MQLGGIIINSNLIFSSVSNEWETPQDFYDKLNFEFNFTLDPCCQEYSHKCIKYYTSEMNGLDKDWVGETVFCNPPYGREIAHWVKKCYEESLKESTTVVMLIPARTDTRWFHDYIYKKSTVEIRFLKGRIKFKNPLLYLQNSDSNIKPTPAPFPSMIVIFR